MNSILLTEEKNHWIVSRKVDLPIFLLLPIFILVGYSIFSIWVSVEILFVMVFSLGAFGHHLPGFIRAYTDSLFLKQYIYRLTVIPVLLLIAGIVLIHYNLGVLGFLAVAWSLWHGCLQNYGFLKIYDLKANTINKKWIKLDFWTYITCYFSIIFFFGSRQSTLVASFYEYGGFVIPSVIFWSFKWILWIFAGFFLCLFVFSHLNQWKKKEKISIQKLVFFITSLLFWFYCMKLTSHVILGLLLAEIFHDVQYNVFVWYYNRKRVENNLSQSKLEQFLFRKSWLSLLVYGGIVLLYGAMGLLDLPPDLKLTGSFFDLSDSWIFDLFVISGILHFYFDSFIWKIRDEKVQRDLGVITGKSQQKRIKHSNLFHNTAWILLFSTMLCMGLSEYHYRNLPLKKQIENRVQKNLSLAHLVPRSWLGNFSSALHYEKTGDYNNAISYYNKAIESYPEEVLNYIYLANTFMEIKQYEKAIKSYQQALKMTPRDIKIQETIYRLFLKKEQYFLALNQLLLLIEEDPLNSSWWSEAGQIYYFLNDFKQAKYYLTKVVDSGSKETIVWEILAEIATQEKER